MTNIYFPDEEISRNDIFFVCYMIERVARRLHQRNRYVVNQIGRKSLEHLVSVANVQMGKVYERLIHDTKKPGESEVDGIIRVYNHEICDVIDNYNCSAYYEPSYVIARAYYEGGF